VTEYTFGIEEEYFVVGRRTGNIKTEFSPQERRFFATKPRRATGNKIKSK
jgi:hypothetical protein